MHKPPSARARHRKAICRLVRIVILTAKNAAAAKAIATAARIEFARYCENMKDGNSTATTRSTLQSAGCIPNSSCFKTSNTTKRKPAKQSSSRGEPKYKAVIRPTRVATGKIFATVTKRFRCSRIDNIGYPIQFVDRVRNGTLAVAFGFSPCHSSSQSAGDILGSPLSRTHALLRTDEPVRCFPSPVAAGALYHFQDAVVKADCRHLHGKPRLATAVKYINNGFLALQDPDSPSFPL